MLAPLAGGGLALMNAGLGRTRNAAHSMMAALCVIAVAAHAFISSAAARSRGIPAALPRVLTVAWQTWDWLGAEPWFFRGLPMNGFTPGAPPAFLFAWLGMVGAGLAGLIPLGSGADRWRLGAVCASTALLSAITFPLFAHWSLGRRLAGAWE